MHFALNDDQVAVRDMARDFAAEKIAPHALRWDEDKHFPVDVIREAAGRGRWSFRWARSSTKRVPPGP